MVKIVENFDNTAAYFSARLQELIDEIYEMDDSVSISGDMYVQELVEKLHRHLRKRR